MSHSLIIVIGLVVIGTLIIFGIIAKMFRRAGAE